ncbi:MAG: nucleotidyltransferase family protein [Sulfurovum sp.]
MPKSINKTIKFLLIASKSNLSREDIFYLSNYLYNRELDDNQIITLTQTHKITKVVYTNLKKHFPNDSLVTKLQKIFMINSQKSMLLSAELLHITKLLEKQNIDIISFKGASLSQLLYGDIISRQYSDLDILIELQDRDNIYEILSQNGYEKTLNITLSQEEKWYKNSKDMLLFHKKRGIHIELHWLLVDRDFPMDIELDSIKKECQNITINRQNIKIFGNEDLLIYLTIHGSTHLWHSIGWIKDIDMMIRGQNIDWDKIEIRLNITQRGAFLLGLYLSNSLLDTPIPHNYKEESRQKWLIALTDFIIKSWQEPISEFKIRVAIVYILPNIKTRVKYLYKVIINPTRSEYDFIDLPKGFYWLYYIIRPFLLFRKYF